MERYPVENDITSFEGINAACFLVVKCKSFELTVAIQLLVQLAQAVLVVGVLTFCSEGSNLSEGRTGAEEDVSLWEESCANVRLKINLKNFNKNLK